MSSSCILAMYGSGLFPPMHLLKRTIVHRFSDKKSSCFIVYMIHACTEINYSNKSGRRGEHNQSYFKYMFAIIAYLGVIRLAMHMPVGRCVSKNT